MNPMRLKILLCWLVIAGAACWFLNAHPGSDQLLPGIIMVTSYCILCRMRHNLPSASEKLEVTGSVILLICVVMFGVTYRYEDSMIGVKFTILILFSFSLFEDVIRLNLLEKKGPDSVSIPKATG